MKLLYRHKPLERKRTLENFRAVEGPAGKPRPYSIPQFVKEKVLMREVPPPKRGSTMDCQTLKLSPQPHSPRLHLLQKPQRKIYSSRSSRGRKFRCLPIWPARP